MRDNKRSEFQKDKAFLQDGNTPTFIIGDKEYNSIDEMPPLLQKIFSSLENIPGISFPGSKNPIDITTISGDRIDYSQESASSTKESPTISSDPLHPESTNPLHTNRTGDYLRTSLVILGIIGLVVYFIFSS